MLPVIIICAVSCVAMILLVFLKPSVKIGESAFSIYWAAPLAGALTLFFCGFLTFDEIIGGICADTEVNPLKILILFLSMTMMSIFLDEAGFFSYLASAVLKRAGNSRMKLFIYLYITYISLYRCLRFSRRMI